MVDPVNITNYTLDDNGLEEHILFWVLAAGKNGLTAAKALSAILDDVGLAGHGPFHSLRCFQINVPITDKTSLPRLLKSYGVGCYNHKARTIYELVRKDIDLKTCTVDELESIYGIGPKTARCFIIHTRPNAKYAGLDTHILKFLRSLGHTDLVSTPQSKKKYEELEKIFLTYVEKSGKTVAEFDLEVWNHYRKTNQRYTYMN